MPQVRQQGATEDGGQELELEKHRLAVLLSAKLVSSIFKSRQGHADQNSLLRPHSFSHKCWKCPERQIYIHTIARSEISPRGGSPLPISGTGCIGSILFWRRAHGLFCLFCVEGIATPVALKFRVNLSGQRSACSSFRSTVVLLVLVTARNIAKSRTLS